MIIGFFSDHAPNFGLVPQKLLSFCKETCLTTETMPDSRAGVVGDVADIGNENDQAS